ncbi:MAG: hypothetical protein GF331_10385 [Chitinivibrionales bacterium]|nr:hypothetical protein [Chitinivibrionales bacterium]
MASDQSRIYLIAPKTTEWVDQFRSAVADLYQVAIFAPNEVPKTDEDSPAKGVVVYYDAASTPGDNSWVEDIRHCIHYMDLPLIAVAPSPSPAVRAQLLAAGASKVCNAEDEPQTVVREVENRCNLEPVMKEIRTQLLDPFVQSTVHTVREMAGDEPNLHSVYRKQGYRIFGDHSAIISLTADSEGTLVLSFPKTTSCELGRRMLAPMGVEVTEELVQSCLGELTNIIAGQAKGVLAETGRRFTMSTPTVVSGQNHEIRYKPGLPCLVASFTSGMGDFALQLCMAF